MKFGEKWQQRGNDVTEFEHFHYKTFDELNGKLEQLGISWPYSENLGVLFEKVELGSRTLSNRFAIQPMEGCDCSAEGTPGDLTLRRYRRFASGGAGLLWTEACAVAPEGRANPRQMMITRENVDAFARIVGECRRLAKESMGSHHEPVLILQLTHSGRYSKPDGVPVPIIAHHSKVLDAQFDLPENYPLIEDGELERLQEAYVKAAKLALQAGFDGVDVKACHGYLIAELLASHTRENSRYGGEDFENRTRFLREVHQRLLAEVPTLIVTTRMNA